MRERNTRSPEQEKPTPEMEVIQYGDGQLALRFTGEGVISNKYVDFGNPLIVTTASGNKYGYGGHGGGVVINANEGTCTLTPSGFGEIVLGEPLTIPTASRDGQASIMRTTPVVSVLARYKHAGASRHEGADDYVDTPSPFASLERALMVAEEELGAYEYYAPDEESWDD